VENNALTKLNDAVLLLAEVKTVQEAQYFADLAEAARVYAEQMKLGLEAQNYATEIKLRAERKAGEILKETELHKGGRPKKTGISPHTGFQPPKLSELNITKIKSSRFQVIASIPEEIFEQYIAETKEKGKELTTKELLVLAKNLKREKEIEEQKRAIELGIDLPSGEYDVIVVDPPWPYGTKYNAQGRRAASPYPEMSLEELSELELPAADNCVLFLWTTHKFMRYSFGLIDIWGFKEVAIITWVKNRIGLGEWLRSQSEFCIMCIKGKPTVNLSNQTTVINGPMREHSRKPDEFYHMVDSLCIGRKLDYFSREKREGWDSFGNQISLFNEDEDELG